jgi:hypothetical protein
MPHCGIRTSQRDVSNLDDLTAHINSRIVSTPTISAGALIFLVIGLMVVLIMAGRLQIETA